MLAWLRLCITTLNFSSMKDKTGWWEWEKEEKPRGKEKQGRNLGGIRERADGRKWETERPSIVVGSRHPAYSGTLTNIRARRTCPEFSPTSDPTPYLTLRPGHSDILSAFLVTQKEQQRAQRSAYLYDYHHISMRHWSRKSADILRIFPVISILCDLVSPSAYYYANDPILMVRFRKPSGARYYQPPSQRKYGVGI